MSESKFIEAMVRRMPAEAVLDAVTDGADEATGREHIGIFVSASTAIGVPRMKVLSSLLSYVFDIKSTEHLQSRGRWRAAVMEAVLQECKENPVQPGEINDQMRTAIDDVVKIDDVETFVMLDQAGLVDHEKLAALKNFIISDLVHYFAHAISHRAVRCNQYLLATAGSHVLAAFPQEERTWAKDIAIARDIAASIPPADVERCVEIVADREVPEGGRANAEINQKAESVTVTLLERAAEVSGGALTPAGERLLAAALQRSIGGWGGGMDRQAEVVLLGVMHALGRLDTKQAFQLACRVLRSDMEGRVDVAPEWLQALIEAGLPIEPRPEWFDDNAIRHLLLSAPAKHFDVLSEHVPDKLEFMQRAGASVVMAHASEPCHRGGRLRGAENHELMRLAELGFPFGPIDIPQEDGQLKTLALFERLRDREAHRAADPFIVGHMAGHLGPEHRYDGVGPVHVAVAYKSATTAAALARKGFSVDELCTPSSDRYGGVDRRRFHPYKGMTPLIMALKIENAEDSENVVRALLDAGADTTIKAPTGSSALQLAKTPELKTLLRAGRVQRAMDVAVDEAVPAEAQGQAKARGPSPL